MNDFSADNDRFTRLMDQVATLDMSTYIFHAVMDMGIPKFTDARVTAYVTYDILDRLVYVWGREFFDWLEDDDLLFVVIHETLHVLLGHITRAAGKIPDVWNIAADIQVNYLCEVFGHTPFPGLHTWERYIPLGVLPWEQTTEEIYERLLPFADKLQFNGSTGDHSGWEKLTPKQRDLLEEVIQTASQHNRLPECLATHGSEAGDAALGELRESIAAHASAIQWEQFLTRHLRNREPKPVECWDRPRRRLGGLWGRVCLPNVRKVPKPSDRRHIHASLDASGSIDSEMLGRWKSFLKNLPAEDLLTLSSFDTRCYPLESLDAKVRGGGGTDPRCVIKHVEKLGDVDDIIVLTDGEFAKFSIPDPAPWVFLVDGTTENIPEGCRIITV